MKTKELLISAVITTGSIALFTLGVTQINKGEIDIGLFNVSINAFTIITQIIYLSKNL